LAKKKFYVVWEGHQRGVFEDWERCERAIKAFQGARYKSFENEAEARKAINDPWYKHIKPKSAVTPAQSSAGPIADSISVDAAYSSSSQNMEYQGVYTANKAQWFRVGPIPKGTNNVGEFLAIVHALALCQKQKINLPIYTDSMTAMAWIRNKRANTKLEAVPENEKLFEYIERAEEWLKNNTWNNKILKWDTQHWGEIPADFGRK
jgi:ribonuclease HI